MPEQNVVGEFDSLRIDDSTKHSLDRKTQYFPAADHENLTLSDFVDKYCDNNQDVLDVNGIPLQTRDELLKHNPVGLFRPITRLKKSGKLEKMALEIFDNICSVINSGEFGLGFKLCFFGIKYPQLRDEIYLQICKQVTKNNNLYINNWIRVLINGWTLMTMCTSCFPPSLDLRAYLLAFFSDRETHETSSDVQNLISKSIDNVLTNGNRCRRVPLTQIEFYAEQRNNPLFCKIIFMNGKTTSFELESTLTFGRMTQNLCESFNLGDYKRWEMYLIVDGEWKLLKREQFFFDVLFENFMTDEGLVPISKSTLSELCIKNLF